MSEVGRENGTYKKGYHEKRPQDAVLEKAVVVSGQTWLSPVKSKKILTFLFALLWILVIRSRVL